MEESKTLLGVVCEVVRFLSAASLGLFSGGMLTEACILVPYWRSLSSREFFVWYGAHGQRLQRFFGPLTTVTGLLALTAALLSLGGTQAKQCLTLLAAGLSLVVVSTFFLYFGKANASFAQATIGVDQVGKELKRWATWHWWRTGLSFIALTAAMMSLW